MSCFSLTIGWEITEAHIDIAKIKNNTNALFFTPASLLHCVDCSP